MKRFLLATVFLSLFPVTGYAETTLKDLIKQPEVVGEARYKAYYTDWYDLELLAREGLYEQEAPYALRFTYLQPTSKEKIIDRMLDEMAAQGFQNIEDEEQLESWRTVLLPIIPDVKKRDVLMMVRNEQKTSLFHNGTLITSLEDELLTESLFRIWLGEDTSKPALRDKLTGAE